jgi:hypothetical protein
MVAARRQLESERAKRRVAVDRRLLAITAILVLLFANEDVRNRTRNDSFDQTPGVECESRGNDLSEVLDVCRHCEGLISRVDLGGGRCIMLALDG